MVVPSNVVLPDVEPKSTSTHSSTEWQRGEFQTAWYKEHLHKGKDSKVTTEGLEVAPPTLPTPNHVSKSGFLTVLSRNPKGNRCH